MLRRLPYLIQIPKHLAILFDSLLANLDGKREGLKISERGRFHGTGLGKLS
jgi:hypothetical protein